MSGEATFAEAFNLLCGNKLGEGIHRTVFACRIRPDLVDLRQRLFSNLTGTT